MKTRYLTEGVARVLTEAGVQAKAEGKQRVALKHLRRAISKRRG